MDLVQYTAPEISCDGQPHSSVPGLQALDNGHDESQSKKEVLCNALKIKSTRVQPTGFFAATAVS